MLKEQQPTPIQQVERAIKGLVQPWVKTGMELPSTSVIELSRLAHLPPATVLNVITEGKVILNGSAPPKQAVIDGEAANVRKAQPGPFYQKTAAEIWSEGQRYQRRFQFQPINTRGKPTRKRIEARVVEEQIKRAKIQFVPYINPNQSEREQKAQKLSLRWAKKAEQVYLNPEEQFVQTLAKEAHFPTQNFSILKQNLEAAQKEGHPFKIGCFVCLVNEWVIVNGEPAYKVSTDPNVLSRLEQDPFVRRSQQLFKALDKTGVPYQWTFLIADTDANELYGEWEIDIDSDQVAIEAFEKRVGNKLCRFFPDSVKTKLWSQIQVPYSGTYSKKFNGVMNGSIVIPNLPNILKERTDYYRSYYLNYFNSRGFVASPLIVETLSTVPPKRNIALYAAQGPIIEDEFDCLVIGDRNPLRCGRNQSVIAGNLPIWYPYPGG